MGFEPIRVLHLVHAFAMGGMENGIVNLANGLEALGIETHVCALSSAGAFRQRLPASCQMIELGKTGGFSLRLPILLRQQVRRIRPAVIHSHNWTGLIYAISAGLPQLAALLHGEHAELYGWERQLRRLWLRRLCYRFCKRVHTVSQGQLDELKMLKLAPPNALAIPNGVDTNRFKPSDPALLGLPDNAIVLGMVSRFIPEKQHARLLNAFAQLDMPNLHLLLIGDGGNIKQTVLELAKEHPFHERIHWLGERNDMPAIYSAMSLLVLPSEAEGMSNACLEAAACGVPTLANACCGVAELIADGVTGLIRPMKDAATIASALVEAFHDLPNLRRLGTAAALHVQKNFSLSLMIQRYAGLYRELASL